MEKCIQASKHEFKGVKEGSAFVKDVCMHDSASWEGATRHHGLTQGIGEVVEAHSCLELVAN